MYRLVFVLFYIRTILSALTVTICACKKRKKQENYFQWWHLSFWSETTIM